MLVYNTVFIQTILFNSEAWSNIQINEIEKLKVVQLKYLKRVLKVPTCCPNAFVYLELGVLPIEQEIHLKKLSFLWKILNTPEDDPVRSMYNFQNKFPAEQCWRSSIKVLRETYCMDEDSVIQKMSKNYFKTYVKEKIRKHTFSSLKQSLKENKNCAKLKYEEYKEQWYLTELPPNLASVVTRIRCHLLNIASHRPYLFGDETKCRSCEKELETLEHIINCSAVRGNNEFLQLNEDIFGFCKNIEGIAEIGERVHKYLDA